MRDYKELVSVLRCEADGFLMADAPDVLMADSLNSAANAIEELQKSVELEHQSGFADGQISANRKKNRWISVEDENGQV